MNYPDIIPKNLSCNIVLNCDSGNGIDLKRLSQPLSPSVTSQS